MLVSQLSQLRSEVVAPLVKHINVSLEHTDVRPNLQHDNSSFEG